MSLLQVNLVLGDGRSLGLTIRGGAEYGLGIYITGVDPGSEAESSGLKVRGDGAGARLCAWSEGGDDLCVELFAAAFHQTSRRAVSTHLWAGPGWEPSPGCTPLIHSSEQQQEPCPHLPRPEFS